MLRLIILLASISVSLTTASLTKGEETPFDQVLEIFNAKALERHNYYRSLHGVEPIVYNSELAVLAQRVANASAEAGRFVTERPLYGRVTPGALYASVLGFRKFDGCNLTDTWYHSRDKSGARNYGQVIWKNTKQAGFGFSRGADGRIFFVGLYHPPGNIVGQEADNILPLVNSKRIIFPQISKISQDLVADDSEDDDNDESGTSPNILNKFFLSLLNKLNEIKIEPELAVKGVEWIDKISNKLNALKSNFIFKK